MSQIDFAPLAPMAHNPGATRLATRATHQRTLHFELGGKSVRCKQCGTLLLLTTMSLGYWITLLLSLVGQVIATWRLEFVKCIHSNYERNASRSSTMCTHFDRFFCCQEDERCCSLQQFLNELRVLFYSVIILAGITLLLFTLLVTNGIYILIRTKNLSNIFTKSKQAGI